MASKLLVVCALACAVQGLNAAMFMRPERPERPEGPGRHPPGPPAFENSLFRESFSYFQNMEKEYGSAIEKFEDNMYNLESPEIEFAADFESVMEPLEEFEATEMDEEAAGNNIIRECIRAERENFQKLVMQTRQRMREAAMQLRQFIRETVGPYVQAAREAFRALGDAVALFPAKMWECIQEGNIMKAIQVVRETRMAVTTNASIIGKNIREARSKLPMIREKARQMRQQIQNEVAAGMKAIRQNIRQCIVNGGPKPIVDVAVPEQVPITMDIPVTLDVPVDQVSTLVAPEEQISTLVAPADAVISTSA